MSTSASPRVAAIQGFFEKTGSERFQGLDSSYFVGLNETEKEEAWNFLSYRFATSTDTINGLYYLDPKRAVAAFKKEIEAPIEFSQFRDEREFEEECRLLMLQYVYAVEPNEMYVAAINKFANSESKRIRALFAQCVPTDKVTHEAVDALKRMIFSETDVFPRAVAIQKFMVIHGMDFDRKNPMYISIYRSLSSDDPKEKAAAIKQLEDLQHPDYA
jgi:hypothetical protein